MAGKKKPIERRPLAKKWTFTYQVNGDKTVYSGKVTFRRLKGGKIVGKAKDQKYAFTMKGHINDLLGGHFFGTWRNTNTPHAGTFHFVIPTDLSQMVGTFTGTNRKLGGISVGTWEMFPLKDDE